MDSKSSAEGRQRRAVEVELVSGWSATPVHLEAAEFFAEEGSRFWEVVEALHDTDVNETTEEALYRKVTQFADAVLPQASRNLLHYALLARYYSPKVEMFRQYARTQAAHCGSDAWVHVGTHLVCTPGELQRHLEKNLNSEGTAEEAAVVFDELEHLYPNAAPPSAPLAVLYGQMGTPAFAAFHALLRDAANASTVRYAVRHFTPEEESKRLMNVQGYGVELAIKSTEYKVIDDKVPEKGEEADDALTQAEQEQEMNIEGFQFDKLKQRRPELTGELDAFREHLQMLSQQNEGFQQLRAWQIKSLGYQASQRILSAADPLQLLRDIAQNFPPIANSLARLRLDADVRSEIEDNQDRLNNMHLARNFIHLHGRTISAESLNPFVLYELLKDERSKQEALSQFGLAPRDVEKLLALVPIEPTVRFDLRDRELAPDQTEANPDANNVNGAIQFANDLEKDPMYANWPGLHSLLQPLYPGQLRYVKKNLQTLIAVLDPSSPQGIALVTNLHYMVAQGLPFRVGFVFTPAENQNADDQSATGMASLIIKSYFYLRARLDALDALAFFRQLYDPEDTGEITSERVWSATRAALGKQGRHLTESEWRKDLESEEIAHKYRNMQRYVEQKGLALTDKDGQYLFTNGKFHPVPAGAPVNNALQQLLMQENFYGYNRFIEATYKRELQKVDDLWSWILQESPPVFDRFSPLVFEKSSSNNNNNNGGAAERTWISLAEHRELLAPHTAYLSYPNVEFELKEFSHLVVGDLTTRAGLAQALEAVQRLSSEDSGKVRVGFLHNTEKNPLEVSFDSRGSEFLVARAIQAALTSGKTLKRVFPFVTQLLATALDAGLENVKIELVEELARANELKDFSALMTRLAPQAYALFERDRRIAGTALGLQPGQRALLTNGKIVRLQDQVLRVGDLKLLEAYESLARVDQIKVTLDAVSEHHNIDPDDLTSEFYSNELAAVVSVLSALGGSEHRVQIPELKPSFVAGEKENPVFQITAVLDPLSKGAQQIAPLLLSLVNNKMGVQVNVVLNPQRELTELPLKSFYRFVLQDDLVFDSTGRLVQQGSAVFNNLPTSLLLTTHMHTPHSWVVQAIRSPHDLDNILLKDSKEHRLSATFELQHLLAEGQCIDAERSAPAVGLQINLGDHRQPHISDTTVMANLGYFQLKANPGHWWLSLGKRFGDEDVDNNNNNDDALRPYRLLADDGRTPIPRHALRIHRFSDGGIYDLTPYLVKRLPLDGAAAAAQQAAKPGKANNEADKQQQQQQQQQASLWNQVYNYFNSGGATSPEAELEAKKPEDETIHIFSVASGHLYERFLKIMMLTVLKNTKSPVKFWFLENYLSPKFKEYAPLFSATYNTSIELVTYQWPSWLHHETEKQRVIWGYKILFLDVLFPMDLRKIIFVDADQIVRTDLRELYDMDLHGAPLAYTPFCSSRTEMNGFRFWDSGFWKNHLRGRPYHISALYVVDLKRFREMGAGDTIRATYQQLSQDANSLANLDQDLPNFLQEQVPIFSLPQEWLWCETWCDDESKPRAKTIDLCNNPLTKTPKLENAVRIIPEWRDLDEEARRVEDRLLESTASRSVEDSSSSSSEQHVGVPGATDATAEPSAYHAPPTVAPESIQL